MRNLEVGKKVELEPLQVRVRKTVERLDKEEDSYMDYQRNLREKLIQHERPYQYVDDRIAESPKVKSKHPEQAKEFELRQEKLFSVVIAALESVISS